MSLDKNYITVDNVPGKFISKREIQIIDGNPNISVIKIYNGRNQEFEISLKSIINQTLYNFEIIIVSHNAEEFKKYIEYLNIQDSRIRVIEYNFKNSADAKNYAIKNSNSDYICLVNEKIYLDKTYLECLNIAVVNNSRKFGFSNVIDKTKKFEMLSDSIDEIFKNRFTIYTGAYIISKDCFNNLSGFIDCENEDFELWIRLIDNEYYPVKINNYGIWSDRENIKDSAIRKSMKNIENSVEFPVDDIYNMDTFPILLSNSTKFKKTKKNLLIIFPCVVVGGADKFLLDLVRGLDKDEYEITLIFTRVSDYVWRPLFELEVYELFDLTDFARREEWAGFIEYIIRSRQIDLVFCSNSMYAYHLIPWIKTKHPDLPITDYIHAEDWTWKAGGLPRDSIAVSKFIDKTFTCTNHLKNVMKNQMNKKVDNTMPVYIGVDNEYFDSAKVNLSDYDFYKKIKKYEDKKVILFMCRLVHLKRPIFAVKVLQNLVKQDKNIVLFVVGNGECLSDMKREVEKLKLENNIEFFGMQKDVRPFYKLAKVTIVTSLTEGLTLTAYESLSMGTPVVSADVGGQKELIDDKCGKIIRKYQDYVKDLYNYDYDQNEINEYTNAILEIVNSDNYSSISNYCKDKINKKFSVKIMVDTLSNEFKKIIENGTNINREMCNNEELAERYLILYNDTFKYFKSINRTKKRNILYKCFDLIGITPILKFLIINSNILNTNEKYKLKYMLWDIPAYRFLIISIKKILRKY